MFMYLAINHIHGQLRHVLLVKSSLVELSQIKSSRVKQADSRTREIQFVMSSRVEWSTFTRTFALLLLVEAR